jgi:AcrR family transcriptional regulator
MRASTETSQLAIRRSALATFCERGYRATTLEEIGARVGVTRGTVLHHFKSKPDLLHAVMAPYLDALTGLIDSAEVQDPPTASERRVLLIALADLFLQHRRAVQLLATDVAARVQLGLVDVWAAPSEGLVGVLLGSRADGMSRVRMSAALGAMVQPIASVGLDLPPAWTRSELVGAALAVLERPVTTVTTARGRPTETSGTPRVIDRAVST